MSLLKQVEVNWKFTPNNTEMFNSASSKTLANINHLMIEVPKANNLVLDHTGSELTQEFTNLNEERVNVSGDVSATDAGEYTSVFDPKYGCEWPDETKESKEVKWYISDQTNQFTVDNSGTVTDLTDELKESESIIFPNKVQDKDVTAIGSSLLKDNEVVKSVVIPETVKEIKDDAFSGCTNLEKVVIPETVSKIGDNAFNECTSLEKVDYKGTEEEWNNIEVGTGNNNLLNLTEITVPTLTVDQFIYDGTELTPEFIGYAQNKMTMSGDVSATNAGVYTVTFTLKDGYEWGDGSVDPKLVTWTIGKATPVVTSVTTSGTEEYGTPLSTIVPTVDSNVEGTFTWVTTDDEFSTMMSPATVKWLFTPNDLVNYTTLSGESTIIIDEIDITVLPSQNGTLTYNGSELTPSWNNYDTNQLTISGITKGTNAGEYKATFTPKDKYEWSDGTRDAKEVTWSIGKVKITTVPSLNGVLKSNGSEQSPTWANYNSSQLTLGGTTSATNVGTYIATFTPKANYTWSDGSITTKSVSWDIDYENFTVTANNRTLIGYTGAENEKLVIPATFTYDVDNTSYKIINIGDKAFNDCTNLKEVVIPNTVTSIGDSAFKSCTALTSIVIPNSVTSIGVRNFGSNSVFEGCTALTSIVIPNSVTKIGASLFSGCTSLKSINIPEGVTSIGDRAFAGCSALTSIDIPNNVTYIGINAFKNCIGLTTINIPNSVTSIENYAFSGCEGLTSVNINEGVTSIGSSVFEGCTALTSIEIPNSVTSIGNSAFSGCEGLTSILLSNSINAIKNDIFYECSALTSIVIPNSVTSIGSSAFCGCTSLKSINIPEGVTSIGAYAFNRCSALTSIVIPNSVTSIENYAFTKCTRLTSITFKDTTTWYVGTSADTATTKVDVTNTSTNITYMGTTYSDKVWVKK